MSDSDLWDAFRRGDQNAFRTIYDLYSRDLMNYGFKITDDPTVIEDCIHDLFIELWDAKKLSDTDSIKFYLFAALRNKLSAALKKSRIQTSDAARIWDAALAEPSVENNWIDNEGKQQLLSQLHRSYNRLTGRQQQALHLRFYMHFSNEEIAEIMGVNYQSACKFIYTGLKVLRDSVRILSVAAGFILFKGTFLAGECVRISSLIGSVV